MNASCPRAFIEYLKSLKQIWQSGHLDGTEKTELFQNSTKWTHFLSYRFEVICKHVDVSTGSQEACMTQYFLNRLNATCDKISLGYRRGYYATKTK
jgi:hypothetical protein